MKNSTAQLKISIISFDLSNNCLGRAYLLGKVLRRHYDVEIHGFVFPPFHDAIWKPCDTGEFQYHAIPGGNFPSFLKSMLQMIKNIRGNVIYASKLRFPSYGAALLKKLFSRIPVVLDIDDLETSWYEHIKGKRRWKTYLEPNGPLITGWMEHLVGWADEITTVSTQFQKKYGSGIIIPHGKDTTFFDPAKFDREKIRKQLQVASFKIIMFLGSAVEHKGLADIVQAMHLLDRDDIRLMIVGAGSNPTYENMLKELGRGKVLLQGKIPFSDIPAYLQAADLVVLPQRRTLQSLGQIPAKIFDAMAMAKPIISTNVSDIPQILEGCGIVVESEDISALAEKIAWVFSNPDQAAKMGKRAREKCIAEYSWDVMEKKLVDIFEKYK